jgi:predicted signal transduction protein with EAL and GGDEF domain
MLERSQNFGGLTVSIGVASRRPRAERDASALVRDADVALYRAKANGRNRCEMFMATVSTDLHALPVAPWNYKQPLGAPMTLGNALARCAAACRLLPS